MALEEKAAADTVDESGSLRRARNRINGRREEREAEAEAEGEADDDD